MTSPATVGIPVSRPRRRGTELGLLIVAVLIAACGQLAVSLGHDQHLQPTVLWYAIALLALFAAAHLAVRRLAPYADPVLLPVVALLNGLGLAMIHRLDLAASDSARARGVHLPQADASLQLAWTAIGVGLFVLVLFVLRDHRTLARYGYTCALIGIGLLLLPSVLPASISSVNGARVWIRVSGFSIQPSEVSKLLLMVFFASYLVSKRQVLSVVTRSVLGLDLPRARDLGPVLVAWLASMLVLVRENSLGSAALFFGIFVVMLYVATQRVSWLIIGVGLFAAGGVAANLLFTQVHERFDIWLHPFRGTNPTNHAYQLVQGLFGFATGGILGTGLGRGQPQDVPFARTDFILASLGEELGLVGVAAVLALYLVLVSRGLRAAIGVRDSFGKLLAGGLAVSVALEVFVVAGGVMRVIPLTGVTLPFVSYGGSSVVANYVLVALLVRISAAGREPAATMPIVDAPTQVVHR